MKQIFQQFCTTKSFIYIGTYVMKILIIRFIRIMSLGSESARILKTGNFQNPETKEDVDPEQDLGGKKKHLYSGFSCSLFSIGLR